MASAEVTASTSATDLPPPPPLSDAAAAGTAGLLDDLKPEAEPPTVWGRVWAALSYGASRCFSSASAHASCPAAAPAPCARARNNASAPPARR